MGIGNLIESRIPSWCNSSRSTSEFNAGDASASDWRRVLHAAAVARIEVMSCAPSPALSTSATIAVGSSRILVTAAARLRSIPKREPAILVQTYAHPASRLFPDCFVLQNVPVLDKDVVDHANDDCRDRVARGESVAQERQWAITYSLSARSTPGSYSKVRCALLISLKRLSRPG